MAVTEDHVAIPQHKGILPSQYKEECSKQQVATEHKINTKKRATKRKAQNLPKEGNKDDGELNVKESVKDVEVQGIYAICYYYCITLCKNEKIMLTVCVACRTSSH